MIDSSSVGARRGDALAAQVGRGRPSCPCRRARRAVPRVSAPSRASTSVMSAIFLRSGGRVDAVLGVVRDLLLAAAVGLVDRLLHRVGEHVGVHVHLARHVAGGAADCLDERASTTRRKPSLSASRIADQRDFGQVETLAQQVDADEHVVDALAAARSGARRGAACRRPSAGSARARPRSAR